MYDVRICWNTLQHAMEFVGIVSFKVVYEIYVTRRTSHSGLFTVANIIVSYFPGNVKVYWIFLFPISCLNGFCATILWISVGSYVAQSAILYSTVSGVSSTTAISMFNSIFWGVYEMSQIAGNLTASVLLRSESW